MKNERMLLNTLLAAIHKTDPDIILGHDFLGVSLDVLLHRMRDLKADHWSRIGRFRRSAWPRIGKQGTNIRFLSGRMLCDLSSDAAKEYGFSLGIRPSMEVALNETSSWGKEGVVKAEPIKDDPEALKDAPKGKGGKKDKYKGGLVLDPRKGLWNSYVLVMDFNSLYPSIIQEYNIDFTTIDKSEVGEIDPLVFVQAGEEGQLALPGSEAPQGVLPRIIATLVNRRKQVKSLMKDRSAAAAQLLQWDIKQKAYKLTANTLRISSEFATTTPPQNGGYSIN
ncbi:hypothetical protein BDP27DRAFT_1368527 [Rhodocollybia butyracea]|uniref:DNA-directed DNA polymerase n=1 Tax=Rhodocollybia butyracea TaxID=206335 RepID=A0A9P5PHM4_9AGAR|nr:hypothetical protein BDP27DRAFT_1368527 [Rhodocollybia butyracea]